MLFTFFKVFFKSTNTFRKNIFSSFFVIVLFSLNNFSIDLKFLLYLVFKIVCFYIQDIVLMDTLLDTNYIYESKGVF